MSTFDGPAVVSALKRCGVTHVVWVPDSSIGTWEPALLAEPSLTLLRACREGEAIGIAAGLLLGGKRPLVAIQCTGLFEAGDALRNVVHDLRLPLFLFVGAARLLRPSVRQDRRHLSSVHRADIAGMANCPTCFWISATRQTTWRRSTKRPGPSSGPAWSSGRSKRAC